MMEIDRRNKLVRNVDHNLWTSTVKRARREEGLEVNSLIERLLGQYNNERDLIKAKEETAKKEPVVQILD